MVVSIGIGINPERSSALRTGHFKLSANVIWVKTMKNNRALGRDVSHKML